MESVSGRAVMLELLAESDVLVIDRAPAWLHAHGLDPDFLARAFPRLVVSAVTPFGLYGPYADYAATDLTICMASGVGMAIGEPDRAPLALPATISSYIGAISAAGATMAAVLAQERDGLGQMVDVSVSESLSTLLIGPAAVRGHYNRRARQRFGHRVPGYYPDTILPCKDGFVSLIAIEDEEWRRFVALMGNPEWASDPLFAEKFSRYSLADTLDALIQPWLLTQTKQELFERCQANRVPTAPVNTASDVAGDPHLQSRDFWWTTFHTQLGALRTPGAPVRFSGTPMRARRSAPFLGQHNLDIYCGVLGYSRQELGPLRASGVI